jgi:hypothetical protein
VILGLYDRPRNWSWLLTFHLLSAFLLVGAVLTVTILSIAAGRRTEPDTVTFLRRLALRTNLMLALPAFIAVHLFGQVLAGKEFPKGVKTPSWLDAGFGLTDLFGILGIVVLSLLQWWVLRRAKRGQLAGVPAHAATWLAPLGLALLTVVAFLMAGKPGS